MDAMSQKDILDLVFVLRIITTNCQALIDSCQVEPLRYYRAEVYDFVKRIGFDVVVIDGKMPLLQGPVVRYLEEHHTSQDMATLYPCCLLLWHAVKNEWNNLSRLIKELTRLFESDTVALGYIDAIEAALGRFMDMFLLSPMIFSLRTDLREARRQHEQKQRECQLLERDLLNTTAELKTTQWTLKNTKNELANVNELLGSHKAWLTEDNHIQLNCLLTQLLGKASKSSKVI